MSSGHFVSTNPALERLVANTPPGMAHWAGTGPIGKTCKTCLEYGELGGAGASIKRNRCLKYHQLTRRIGEAIPPNTPACRHYHSATTGPQ